MGNASGTESTAAPQSDAIGSAGFHQRAEAVMPDGIAGYSQLRSPRPLYLSHAEGARIVDVDGEDYIDYMLGAGPLVLGHRHPAIVAALHAAVDRAIPNLGVGKQQVELAERLTHYVPSVEHLRFLPTGTEAVQAAIRIARKYTGRNLIAKFEGAYHGQSENVMVSVAASAAQRGDQAAPERVPYHCQLPAEILDLTVVLPFNDSAACRRIIEQHADDLALILIEPMLGFAGAIPAEPEFLNDLRAITRKHGIVLCFDEVITGFRLAMGGGQAYYDVMPDLTVLGKAIGGGMPLAAVGGHQNIMDVVSVLHHPDDYVFQSGTFSAFPMSIAAGLATLDTMERENTVAHTNEIGEMIRTGLRDIVADCSIAADVTGVGALFHIHFTNQRVRSAREAEDADQNAIRTLHERLLKRGIYFYAGRLGWLSGAHGGDDIGYTLNAMRDVIEEMQTEGLFVTQT